MSTTMRAKLQIFEVEQFKDLKGELYQETLRMSAVGPNTNYPESGLDEDNTFAKFSPMASFSITVMNPALLGKFVAGEKYCVDFTPAVA